MKADELRALSEGDLKIRHEEMAEEFFNLRFQNGTGQLENYKRLALVRRDIARIETIVRERALGIDIPVKAEEDRPKKRRKAEETVEETDQLLEDESKENLEEDSNG